MIRRQLTSPAEAAHGGRRSLLPRSLALALATFTLANLLGAAWVPGFDANLWWIDLRFLPTGVGSVLLAVAALLLAGWALRPACGRALRRAVMVASLALAGVAAANAVTFWLLLGRGEIQTALSLPLSAVLAVGLMLVARAAGRGGRARGNDWFAVPACACAWLLGLPAAQMIFFGNTDYRRPADVAVVLGARTYADGRASEALKDRVRTACQLYSEGRVKKILISGGPGDGAVSEAEAGRRLALQLGVRVEDILLDDAGLNTQATVANTLARAPGQAFRRIIVVSHFYHLPRIKLAFQRAGVDVFTVPARQERVLARLPLFMAREVPAFWVYYWQPLRAKFTAPAPRQTG